MTRQFSLRAVLVALVAATLLPAFAVIVTGAFIERRAALEHAREELNLVARLAASSEEKLVEGVRRMLLAAASTDAVRDLEQGRCTNLFDRLRAGGDFAAVGMTDAQGETTCHDAKIPRVNAADRPFFQRAVASGRFSNGNYLIGRQSGQPSVTFGMPVMGRDGQLTGVAYAAVDLRSINARLRSLPLMTNLLVQLTDADGTVLASNQTQITSVGTTIGPPDLLKSVKQRRIGPVEVAEPDGTPWMHVVMPVDSQTRDGLYIAVSTRQDRVVAQPMQALQRQLLLLLCAAVLGVAVAWWLSHVLVQQPMAALLARVRALDQGSVGEPGASVPAARTTETQRLDSALFQLGERLISREAERDTLLVETQRQSAQLSKAQRLARIAYFEVSLADGRITAPPILAELAGMPIPSNIAAGVPLVGEAERTMLRQKLGQAIADGRPFDAEFRITRPDGREIWLHVLGEIDGVGGQPRRLVGAVQDVSERHRAEEAVREHRVRMESAMQAAELGTYDHDLRTGHAVWLGQHEQMWGYKAGEYDGSQAMFLDRLHVDDRERVDAELERSMRLRLPFHTEYRVVWPDGSVHWIVDSGNTVRNDAGDPLRQVGVVMDVTVQKQAQLELDRMSRRISGVLESTSDGFVSIDRQWRVTYANRHGAKMLGYAPQAMLGRALHTLFPTVGGTEFEVACGQAMAERAERHFDAYYPPWARWFENHLYPTDEGLSIYFRDITERKQAEADIQALVERLEALREMDRALLSVRSIEDVARLGLNKLCALLGCDRASYMGFTADGGSILFVWTEGTAAPVFRAGDVVPLAAVGANLFEMLESAGVIAMPDLQVNGPQLSPMLRRVAEHGVRSTLTLALKVDGKLVGAAVMWSMQPNHFTPERQAIAEGVVDRLNIAVEQVTMRDRIDHHAAELEQRVADRTAEVVSANRELEAFSYSVSHDLRAPLQTVGGFSQALLARHADQLDEKARHYLERINAGAQQMEQLIADLLSLAQVSHADMQSRPTDLAAIARDVVARLRDEHPERQVEVVLPDDLSAWGDRPLLHVLLNNLLGNAWKFTARTEGARIAFGREPALDGDDVVYYVADNGVGFDMRYVERLFTAFRRLHSSQEFPGTGIGLATVHRIVSRHGGRVWAESEPGVRTVLRFTLPQPAAVAIARQST